jgi:drug/metabolite transporter (DMT)-like permease
MSTPDLTLHHHPRRGSLWMLLSLFCFTGNALLLKLLATHRQVDPWLSMSFRAGVGLLLTVILFAPQGSLRLRRSFQSWLLASRGVLGAFGTAAYYITVGPLGAGKATLIGNTWCVFAAIIATFVLGESLALIKLLGILLTFAGLTMLTGMTPGSLAVFGIYEGISLAGAVLAALVVVVIRQLTRTESSATIFASQCVYSLLLAVPISILGWQPVNTQDVLLMIAAACCATCGQLAMTEGFRFLSVAAGGAFQMLVPLVITLSSVLLFAEAFAALQVLGAALVLWGSLQTVVGGKSR